MNLGLLRSRCHLIDRALFFLHIQFPGLEFQNISLNFRENALLFYAPLHNPTQSYVIHHFVRQGRDVGWFPVRVASRQLIVLLLNSLPPGVNVTPLSLGIRVKIQTSN